MCAAEALSITGFAAYVTLLPQLQGEWALSNSEAGLIGGIFFAGCMAAVPVLTSLTDRIDSRRIYARAWRCTRSSALPPRFWLRSCLGLVLDLAGGNQSTRAWGLAFASLGVFGLLAPLARALAPPRAR